METEKTFQIVGKEFIVGGDILKVRFSFSYGETPYLRVQVINMDENLRGAGRLLMHSERDETYCIASNASPELRDKELFLPGRNKEWDDNCVSFTYANIEKRNIALNAFVNMVKAMNVCAAPIVTKIKDMTTVEVGGPKLRVTFRYSDNDEILVVTINEQDNDLRNNLEIEYNGYLLTSCSTPEINGGNTLYVRGDDRRRDRDEPRYRYGSTERRQNAVDAFKKLIMEVNYPWLKAVTLDNQ